MCEIWLRINDKYFLLNKSHFFGVKASISFLSLKKRNHIKVNLHNKVLCTFRNEPNMNVYFKIII